MRGTCGLALNLILQIVAASDDKTKCPGNGLTPKHQDRLTRLAANYNSERCKAAILAEDLPRWISNNAGNVKFMGVEVVAVSSRPDHCSIASRHSRPEMLRFGRTRGRPHAPRMLLGPQVLST